MAVVDFSNARIDYVYGDITKNTEELINSIKYAKVLEDKKLQFYAKVWQELDFLNTCTEGAFRHVRMKFDT